MSEHASTNLSPHLSPHPSPQAGTPLAAKRAALIARCALQRDDAANAIDALVAPVRMDGNGVVARVRRLLGSVDLKVPLTIGGVVLGLIATRPTRALPMLTAGVSLLKFVNSLRRARAGTGA